MSVTFVTAFFGQPRAFRDVDTYFALFRELAATGVDILLFLDHQFEEQGIKLLQEFPNVRIPEHVTLDTSFLSGDIVLPEIRHPTKDTVNYMCIQLEKLHVMSKALQYTSRPYLAWIDFGIFHMIRNKEACTQKLRDIEGSQLATDKIYSPSCWSHEPCDIWNSIAWTFCGSFLLGHRDLFPEAYTEQMRHVERHMPRLTWEVNYWTLMRDLFAFYPADHNDSILLNVPQ